MLKKIISGGQTGVDRGALDAALAAGFSCGGWCPQGKRAEDGKIPDRYPLEETRSAHYLDRTHRNVEDSDGTLIIARVPLLGGTRATARFAEERGFVPAAGNRAAFETHGKVPQDTLDKLDWPILP